MKNTLSPTAISSRQILADSGCIIEGDFFIALRDKMVTKKYVDVGPILFKPDILSAIAENMLLAMPSERLRNIHTIAGPGPIGTLFAIAVANAYQRLTGSKSPPNIVFAEEIDNNFKIRLKGFRGLISGKNVLVIGGMGSTGLSTADVVKEVRRLGGIVKETCFLWNRGNITQGQVGSPTCTLIDEPIQKWDPENCPNWGEFPLVSDIGHPEYFLDYPGEHISLLK